MSTNLYPFNMMSGFRLFMLPFKKQESKKEKEKEKTVLKKKKEWPTGVQTDKFTSSISVR